MRFPRPAVLSPPSALWGCPLYLADFSPPCRFLLQVTPIQGGFLCSTHSQIYVSFWWSEIAPLLLWPFCLTSALSSWKAHRKRDSIWFCSPLMSLRVGFSVWDPVEVQSIFVRPVNEWWEAQFMHKIVARTERAFECCIDSLEKGAAGSWRALLPPGSASPAPPLGFCDVRGPLKGRVRLWAHSSVVNY